jgi:hypothetical protein
MNLNCLEGKMNNLCPRVVRHPTVSVRQEYGLHSEIEAMRLLTTPRNIGAAAALNIKAIIKLNTNMKLKISMEKGMFHRERKDLKKHESNGEAAGDTVDKERNWRSTKAGERLAGDDVDELTEHVVTLLRDFFLTSSAVADERDFFLQPRYCSWLGSILSRTIDGGRGGAERGRWALDGGDGTAWRELRREQAGVGGSACRRHCPVVAAPSAGAAQGRRLLAQAVLARAPKGGLEGGAELVVGGRMGGRGGWWVEERIK